MLKKILVAAFSLTLMFAATAPVEAKKAYTNTIEVAPPADGMAKVVFFRPKKFVGGAVGFIVREGEQELGKLRNGNYFMIETTPGTHTYTVHSEAKDQLNLELEPGEVFFAEGSISMGVMVGRPNLAPSSEAQFRAEKLKPSKPLKKKK